MTSAWRQDAHEALFVFYQQVLAELATAATFDTALRRFELRLLAELGVEVILVSARATPEETVAAIPLVQLTRRMEESRAEAQRGGQPSLIPQPRLEGLDGPGQRRIPRIAIA